MVLPEWWPIRTEPHFLGITSGLAGHSRAITDCGLARSKGAGIRIAFVGLIALYSFEL